MRIHGEHPRGRTHLWLRLTGLSELALLAPLLVLPAISVLSADSEKLQVRRLEHNPIIRHEMLQGADGENINGPSLIKVPEWITNRLGTYYLYFAHHSGRYIRLAYADQLDGPWKIYQPGVLPLEEATGCTGHVASPDVHVDAEHKMIRLYFHSPARDGTGQKSFVALSNDGLHFKASEKPLGIFYFRVFRWEDEWYAMAKGGKLYRSTDGLSKFAEGPNPLPGGEMRSGDYNSPGPRHVAVLRMGPKLSIFYSNIGDAPERIMHTTIFLAGDWKQWRASPPEEVLRPETAYEGANLPLHESKAGAVKGRENALRDPAIFVDEDAEAYLLYSVAGESGIAIAKLEKSN